MELLDRTESLETVFAPSVEDAAPWPLDEERVRDAIRKLGGLIRVERSQYPTLVNRIRQSIRSGSLSTVPDVVDVLDRPLDVETRDVLEVVLVDFGAAAYEDIERSLLDASRSESGRCSLARVIAHMSGVEAQQRVEALCRACQDPNPHLRATVIEAAAAAGLAVQPQMYEMLKSFSEEDPVKFVRNAAADALCGAGA